MDRRPKQDPVGETRADQLPVGTDLTGTETTDQLLRTLVDRLARVEASLEDVRQAVVEKPPEKEWYTPEEVAKLLGRSSKTIQEHCRFHRIEAKKRKTGRGLTLEWVISRAEVERVRNEGLLPLIKHVPDCL